MKQKLTKEVKETKIVRDGRNIDIDTGEVWINLNLEAGRTHVRVGSFDGTTGHAGARTDEISGKVYADVWVEKKK